MMAHFTGDIVLHVMPIAIRINEKTFHVQNFSLTFVSSYKYSVQFQRL